MEWKDAATGLPDEVNSPLPRRGKVHMPRALVSGEAKAMMKTLIILTLLGCDDGVTQCDILHQPQRPFPSQEACQKAADDLLELSHDQPYPTVVTQCATAEATLKFLEGVAPPDQIAEAAKRLRQSSLVN